MSKKIIPRCRKESAIYPGYPNLPSPHLPLCLMGVSAPISKHWVVPLVGKRDWVVPVVGTALARGASGSGLMGASPARSDHTPFLRLEREDLGVT